MNKLKACVFTVLAVLLLWTVAFAGTTETSSITAATIITKATQNLNAANDDFYTEAGFLQWIDEAVREIVNLTDCLEAAAITKLLVDDLSWYDPAQTFLRVTTVEHDNADTADDHQVVTLDRVHKNQIGHGDESGRPTVYCVWNDQIEIWPIPRTAQVGALKQLYIYTVTLPTGVTLTTSAIETPAFLDVALVYYVTAMGHFKNGKMSKGAAMMGLFDQRVKEYLLQTVRRTPIE
jgi:hypothetical protein